VKEKNGEAPENEEILHPSTRSMGGSNGGKVCGGACGVGV